MKKMIILFMLTTSIIYSQDEKVTTSADEYEYFTKIYPEKGEVKDGYMLEPMLNRTTGSFDFSYWFVTKSESKKSVAVLIKIEKNKKKTKWLCLPFNSADLLGKYIDEINSLPPTMSMYFAGINAFMLQDLINDKKNNN